MLKKVISLVAAVALFAGVFTPFAFAEETLAAEAAEQAALVPSEDSLELPEVVAEEQPIEVETVAAETPALDPVSELVSGAEEASEAVEPIEQQNEIFAQTVAEPEMTEESVTAEIVEAQETPAPMVEPDTEFSFYEGDDETDPYITEDTYNAYMVIDGHRVEVHEAYDELRSDYLSSGEWAEPVVAADTGFSYTFLSDNQKAVYNSFYTASAFVTDCKKVSFDENSSPSLDDVKIGVVAVLFDHPEIFWTGGGYSYSYYTVGSNTYIMAVGLSTKKATVRDAGTLATMQGQFNSAAQAVLASVNKSGSKGDIALSVHDALTQVTTYDTAGMNSTEYMPHTAYNALVNHTAVCDGYSKAYTYLLKQCGINSSLLVSDGLNHAWNLIELGSGDYYETDITWDDVNDHLRHDFFNLTTDGMKAGHNGERNTNDFTGMLPLANGTAFAYSNLASSAGGDTGTGSTGTGNTGTGTGTTNEAGVEGFVTRLYQVCLGRNPDAAGKASWVSDLTSGKSDGVKAAFGFVFSNEFKNKNYSNTEYVKHLYNAFMGREPDTAGLNGWVATLNSGTGRIAVFNGFACSAEFTKICASYGITRGEAVSTDGDFTVVEGGTGSQIAAFVTRLYKVCLDRTPDQAGLNDWVNQLASHKITGKSAAHGFVFSAEFQGKNYSNADYVEHLYQAFMGRASDAAGKAGWVKNLDSGASRESVFDGFADSAEFGNICASYGITRS